MRIAVLVLAKVAFVMTLAVLLVVLLVALATFLGGGIWMFANPGMNFRIACRDVVPLTSMLVIVFFLFGVLVYAFSTDGDDNRPHVNG